MFRMPVNIYAEEDLFTKESVEFLKDSYNEEVYDLIANHIEDERLIDIPVWPGYFKDYNWIRPEEIFSALVRHFKSDGMSIVVFADEEKFDKEMHGIPEEYLDVYYKFEFKKDEYDPEDIEDFNFIFDGDYTYAYNPDEDEEVLVNDIEGADFVELY